MSNKKVLIIDDSATDQVVMKDQLEKRNYTIELASSGEEGLEKLKTYQPILVIVDTVLPQLNGFEVCEKIKSLPNPPKVIVITGSIHAVDAKKARDAEADGYAIKTINGDSLLEVMDNVLSTSCEAES
ncbi:MAG: CheY-like chemotaxis protein [Candidatus Omnitrophota bacterium]|jgi:CheY-like chemotaxis protein